MVRHLCRYTARRRDVVVRCVSQPSPRATMDPILPSDPNCPVATLTTHHEPQRIPSFQQIPTVPSRQGEDYRYIGCNCPTYCDTHGYKYVGEEANYTEEDESAILYTPQARAQPSAPLPPRDALSYREGISESDASSRQRRSLDCHLFATIHSSTATSRHAPVRIRSTQHRSS